MSRPGTIGDSHVDIGSIAAFTRNERIKYLDSEKTNNYELKHANKDNKTLVCRLFMRNESKRMVKPPQVCLERMHMDFIGCLRTVCIIQLSRTALSGGASESHTPTEPNNLPGPSSNIKAAPPEVRTGERSSGSWCVILFSQNTGKGPGSIEDSFIIWLHDQVDGPKREWKKAECMGDILPRVKALHEAMENLSKQGWQRSWGGYEVPKGRQFTPHFGHTG